MHMMTNDSQEYCLRWNKHLVNFAESFESLFMNESLVDVTLLADGKQFKAHKIVLSICSLYFQDAFKDLRDKHPIVILKDVKSDHLRALLDYMYKGQVNVAHEELSLFLKTAQSLGIKGFADGLADSIDVNSSHPLSLIRNRTLEPRRHHSPHPPPPPNLPMDMKPILRHIPDMYSCPSTSVNSVLSTALTMPSALSLASPLSLPNLSSLPPALVASTLASTFSNSNAIPHSMFSAPREPAPTNCDTPHNKRRRKNRRPSGGTMDSGDSDARSSGSPGDSAVPNLLLPRISAKIIPVEDLRRQPPASHLPQPPQDRTSSQSSGGSQQSEQQPKDLSIHTSEKYGSSINNHDSLPQKSPRPPSVSKTPVSIPYHLSLEARLKPQDEPENLENRPPPPSFLHLQDPAAFSRFIKSDPGLPQDNHHNDHSSSSPQASRNSLTRRSDEHSREASRPPSKHGSSDPESVVSPSKGPNFQNRHDDTSSDNNHYSDDDLDESSNGVRERSNDFTPGPSSSRPHSEETPQSHGYLGWPYNNDQSSTDESFANISESQSQGLWKNSFKGGILAPYLGSPLGPLPRSPHSHGFGTTFPGLYPGHGVSVSTIGWGRRSASSPPGLLPPHLRSNECSRCGRLYKTRKGLKHHIKNECGVEPRFQCTHCDWKFKQKAHLLRHMARKHTIS